jgi:hypothetical protein
VFGRCRSCHTEIQIIHNRFPDINILNGFTATWDWASRHVTWAFQWHRSKTNPFILSANQIQVGPLGCFANISIRAYGHCNHAHRPRLEKILYIIGLSLEKVQRIFKPLLDPGGEVKQPLRNHFRFVSETVTITNL